jgi:hypothetical protein
MVCHEDVDDVLKEVPPSIRAHISESDVQGLRNLRASFRPHHRHNATRDFRALLHALKTYVGESSDRALICGICWCNDDLVAVKVAQLSRVLQRSKTTLNDALTWVSEQALPICAELRLLLTERIPMLSDGARLRDWSFRRLKPEGLEERRRFEFPVEPPKMREQLPSIDTLAFAFPREFLQEKARPRCCHERGVSPFDVARFGRRPW